MPVNPIEWQGTHAFLVVGTTYHEDTLRVDSTAPDREQHPLLKLTLPTLCITYASMKFINDIGGEQALYPDSEPYGARYFDPPVSLTGGDIEKFTWIRGASKVTIGPQETDVEWRLGTPLVIPRLRINPKRPVEARVAVPKVQIGVDQPLNVAVKQLADGRHIGGLQIEKRHPAWSPAQEGQRYTLRIRVLKPPALHPMREVPILLHVWDPAATTAFGQGSFKSTGRRTTGANGAVELTGRTSGKLEAATLDLPGYAAPAQAWRAMPGQIVGLVFRPVALQRTTISYSWAAGDTPEAMSALVGIAAADIVTPNLQPKQRVLKVGQKIDLPCYAAAHLMQARDSLEWLAARFRYVDLGELAERLKLRSLDALTTLGTIPLPGWIVVYARPGDTLEAIDAKFGLPKGWSRVLGRPYHPEPRLPIERECVAVPLKSFVRGREPS